ncbi:TPA: tRNA (guanosine(37)-N1)-methyltransferase TrmD [Candidatus Bipolaricaulota bacterium]|nr:tRNA (guanosine(37)-N1)-methyltransferase TrmD [Candidatus Bipolaricaulota bacterium]
MRIDILTIFPEMLEGFFSQGVIGQARERGLIEINLHNLRDFTTDKHRTVDDRPYGGGPGMIMKPEPFFLGVEHIQAELPSGARPRVILLSASGKLFTQKLAKELAQEDYLILLCGRYEGVDERVLHITTDELSIGNFVLSGGELAAAVVAEAVARLVPGVVGDYESIKGDAFYDEDLVGPPQWTRPPVFRGLKVPEVLLRGDHKEIEEFRRQKRLEKTVRNRPDLLR